MYIVIHESYQSNRKYIIKYSPNYIAVESGEFTIEDEQHSVLTLTENQLFDIIDSGVKALK